MSNNLKDSMLGKPAQYKDQYDPSLLFTIPRVTKRQEIGLDDTVPFYGEDLWTAYEVSWLMPGGKPQVAIVEFIIPADSENLVESKAIKLYLNSFNQTVFNDWSTVAEAIRKDLSHAAGKAIAVQLFSLMDYLAARPISQWEGESLDEQTLNITSYTSDPEHLSAQGEIVSEILYSDLLKSNCLVTGQPDWGSVQIAYTGPKIDRAALLRYLVGFRLHNEFHEQCVERIFLDLWRQCKPVELTVYARYTRRGGLDINPIRSSKPVKAQLIRLVRQ